MSITSKGKEKTTHLYVYEVFDRKNVRIKGEISARSINMAKAFLKSQGYNIIRLKRKSINIFSIFTKTFVKSEDLTLFTRQMSTLVSAGIPLVQSLSIVADTVPNTPLYNLVQKIRLDVESGTSFSNALKKHPGAFDELYCGLIETGEHSGTLDTMLDRIALYQEKTETLKRKVKKALYYPIAVLIIATIVSTILLVKVVPTFKDMFTSSGAELPEFTQFVLNVSEIIQDYGFYILGVLILAVVLFIYFYRTNTLFNHSIQRLSLKLPIVGPILQKTALARFTRTLSTTTASGVPLMEALDAVSRAAGNIVYTQAIQKIKEGLSTGQQMRMAMRKLSIFPPMVVQMIGIGEESGALESMLGKLAVIYEEEVDTQVDGLTTLLEPLIMVILGVIVGGLVIAMYLPIFKMGALF